MRQRRSSSRLLLSAGIVAATALGVACGGGDSGSDGDPNAGGGSTSSGGPGPASTTPEPASTVCHAAPVIHLAAPVADARARKPFTIAIDLVDAGKMGGPHPLTVVFAKDGVPIKTLEDKAREPGRVEVALDPAITSGLAVGRYTVQVKAGCPAGATEAVPGEATADLHLVRLGVTAIDVQSGDGARVPLMYHAVDHQYDNLFPITTAVASTLAVPSGEPEADDPATGKQREMPKPWDDVATPPVDANGAVLEAGATLPVSLRVGTKPDVVFTIAKSALAPANGADPVQNTGIGEAGVPPIRVAVEGTPGSDASIVKPGEKATVRMATSPVPAVNRYDFVLRWRFEAKAADGTWSEIPGADASATIRLYGVLGNSQGVAAPDLPWVAVVDDATRAVAGASADAKGVRSALTRHVYEELGLAYDRAAGASHYTAYAGSYSKASFRLARFLGRDLGSIVNCSDCASILSTYSNMVGADLHYAIITANFNLHPIMGIGSTAFGSPFDSGRLAFSYHAVTSPDATATIFDATLAVDGDADPASAPYTKKLVQGMDGTEYLQRLSGDVRAKYSYVDKVTNNAF